jgi:hypothetical protein
MEVNSKIKSMEKKIQPFDLDNYQRQGNLAIDMVAACCIHYRKMDFPIKAIVLNPVYYGLLQQWVASKYGEEAAESDFYIDTIEIRKEKIFSGKTLHVEHYPTPKAQA